jgi:hypothetical protein
MNRKKFAAVAFLIFVLILCGTPTDAKNRCRKGTKKETVR